MGIQNKDNAVLNGMRLFSICIVTVFLSIPASGDMDSCPMWDKEYTNSHMDLITGIAFWDECGYLCHTTNGCNNWTWQNYESNYRRDCYLYSNGTKTHTDAGAVSGSKDCYS